MQSRPISQIQAIRHPDGEALNARLLTAFVELDRSVFAHRSHFIDDRFENLYIAKERLPGLADLIDFARDQAQTALGPAAPSLRCGFWLNAMQPGQRTSRHSHEENDELLSGVYYVSAEIDSGDILFHDHPFEIRVTPRPGLMLLFPPELVHSVEPNRSPHLRLSVAFNFGPAA